MPRHISRARNGDICSVSWDLPITADTLLLADDLLSDSEGLTGVMELSRAEVEQGIANMGVRTTTWLKQVKEEQSAT